MLRFFLLSVLVFVATSIYSQDPLPKGMTEAEKLIWNDYLKNYPANKGTTPPLETPRTPAEWEEMQGVIITWAAYSSNLREIVRHAKEHVTVYIVCNNPSNIENYLAEDGVDTENIEFVVAAYNSVWVRDYGPQSIYLNGTNELAFVDWVYNRPRPDDNVIPSVMANELNVPLYQMTQSPNRLVATGGNFMTDGFNQGFSSNLILDENSSLTEGQIDNIKYSYMGIDPYVKMTTLPYDGIHHIDMHMKLLDEETLMVGQYPEGVSDGPQIEGNLNYILNNYQTPYGRPYKVVRIPMPSDENGNYPPNSHYLTYTNAVILNGLVLVPIYGRPQDEEALSIYREAMPGYNIVGINMRNVISASGAIHCITREIAAHDPIFISHSPYRDEVNYSAEGYPVYVRASSYSGIDEVNLHWSTSPMDDFNSINMDLAENNFTATIPQQEHNTDIYYYISATNSNQKTISKPLVAPEGTYSFTITENGAIYRTLFISVDGNGTTSPGIGSHQILEGSSVTLTATPYEGWEFEKWVVNGTEHNKNQIEITISEPTNAQVQFAEIVSNTTFETTNSLAIYPNPSSSWISIRIPNRTLNGTVRVYDVLGSMVLKETAKSESERLNISMLPNGVYFVKFESSQGGWTGRFVKR